MTGLALGVLVWLAVIVGVVLLESLSERIPDSWLWWKWWS